MKLCIVLLVLLFVQSSAGLIISPTELDIGNVNFGKEYQFVITFRNNGSSNLSLTMSSDKEFASFDPLNLTLGPSEKMNTILSIVFPQDLEAGEGAIRIIPQNQTATLIVKYIVPEKLASDNNLINTPEQTKQPNWKTNKLFIYIPIIVILLVCLIFLIMYLRLMLLETRVIKATVELNSMVRKVTSEEFKKKVGLK